MNAAEKFALENLAGRHLGDRESACLQTAEMRRDGSDVALLLDMISAYNQLPESERQYFFEKEFVSVSQEQNFSLLICRRQTSVSA